ncbi:MAG: DUF3325 domain-containing protein [Pseudomonadota bacterium]|nr:DUF3325 domain-containing protein [Pseudomonadota bacterium]
MIAGLLVCGGFAAALGGFSALALAMDRHHEDAYGRGSSPGRPRHWLQGAGALLLTLSLVSCLALQGGPVGVVTWFGILTASALGTVAISTWRPRFIGRCIAAAVVIAVPLITWGTLERYN